MRSRAWLATYCLLGALAVLGALAGYLLYAGRGLVAGVSFVMGSLAIVAVTVAIMPRLMTDEERSGHARSAGAVRRVVTESKQAGGSGRVARFLGASLALAICTAGLAFSGWWLAAALMNATTCYLIAFGGPSAWRRGALTDAQWQVAIRVLAFECGAVTVFTCYYIFAGGSAVFGAIGAVIGVASTAGLVALSRRTRGGVQ